MKLNGFTASYALFVGIWLCALMVLAGCSSVTVSNTSGPVSVTVTQMGTATIPVQVGPGTLPGVP